MGGAGVIDNFLGTFTQYIDSGFGLLGGEVAFIATTLIVSERTARGHVSSILSKLHLANRTQAALYALREGLASLGDAGDSI